MRPGQQTTWTWNRKFKYFLLGGSAGKLSAGTVSWERAGQPDCKLRRSPGRDARHLIARESRVLSKGRCLNELVPFDSFPNWVIAINSVTRLLFPRGGRNVRLFNLHKSGLMFADPDKSEKNQSRGCARAVQERNTTRWQTKAPPEAGLLLLAVLRLAGSRRLYNCF